MKINIYNTTKNTGGAAICCYNLVKKLQENENLSVNYIYSTKKKYNRIQKRINRIKRKFNSIHKYFCRFTTSNPIIHSTGVESSINIETVNQSDADIIHLHWINALFSIKDIAKIKKPVIWTMHDAWPYCGAEHHPNILENDQRFIAGYTRNNKPGSTKGPDICRKTWHKKRKYWKNKKIVFVSPSEWNKNMLHKSALFKDAECHVIPNIIPQNIFYKKNKESCRITLNIDIKKKILGFGAANNISLKNSIKGEKQLLDALNKLDNIENIQLLIFGPASDEFINNVQFPCMFTGNIENPDILSAIYNSLDVFICPSIIENLPTTCIEAQLCGVPVTAFDVGGIPEIVDHKETGYLAKPYDTQELADGIKYCIENNNKLSIESEKRANSKFDNKMILEKHIQLYDDLIKRNKT